MKKIAITSFTLCFFTLLSFGQIPSNGLAGYWPFSGNATDVSPNANNGTVSGATITIDRLGNINGAYSFDGINDYIIVPDDNSINFTNNHSVSVWFKTNSPIINGEWAGCLVNKEETVGSRSYYMFLSQPGGCCADSLSYYMFNTNDVLKKSTLKFSNYYDDKWHMITISYNYTAGVAKIYVDALLKKTVTLGQFNLQQTTFPLIFGASNNPTGGYRWFYKGLLDDICLYNRVLTDAEILSIFTDNSYLGNPIINIGKNDISVFPNPSNNSIILSTNISYYNSIKVEIINTTGSILLNTELQTLNQRIDISSLPEGIYFIRININENIYTKKLTVVKN